jgi:RHS repeat-associated protein
MVDQALLATVTDQSGTITYGYDQQHREPGHYQPLDLANGYIDPATGYLKLGARYYNPTTARFTQPDPAKTCGGFAYAGDNPANYTDPSGLTIDYGEACIIGGVPTAVGGAVTGGIAGVGLFSLEGAAIGFVGGFVSGCAMGVATKWLTSYFDERN